jgi:hypothetical protein
MMRSTTSFSRSYSYLSFPFPSVLCLLLQKDSSLGLKELEWFEDIDLFHAHSPAKTAMAEFFASPQPVSNAGFYKANGARLFKKSRMEVPDDDDEDYFIVPDLG